MGTETLGALALAQIQIDSTFINEAAWSARSRLVKNLQGSNYHLVFQRGRVGACVCARTVALVTEF